MGTDIWLFCEGYLKSDPCREKEWINIDRWKRTKGDCDIAICENAGFSVVDLIDGRRDYGLFYLLAGVRGKDDEHTYLPISPPRGLPEDMDFLIKRIHADLLEAGERSGISHCSHLTLKELKDSGYGQPMKIRGWVCEEAFQEGLEHIKKGEKWQIDFADGKLPGEFHAGRVLEEWEGYLCLNLTELIERMETLKTEYGIRSDEEIRIVFWFGS